MMRVISYEKVPNKTVFHVISPNRERTRSGKIVSNDGSFLKIANSHAINLKNHKICIFDPHTFCHMVRTNNHLDLSKLLKACGEHTGATKDAH